VGEDLVVLTGVRRHDGAGRPSQIYALTPNAAKLFPQRHETLANNMLYEMKVSLSNAELCSLLQRVANKTAQEAPPAGPDQTIEERLEKIAEFLTEKGYNARWEIEDNHYELHACNCPFAGVSDHHPELCAMDQAMMQLLLPTAVRQQSRVLDAAPKCTYIVQLVPTTGDQT
jgi:DeoR family suf operon transcriptional repressor